MLIVFFLFLKFKQVVRHGSVGRQRVLGHLDQVAVRTDRPGRRDQRSSRYRFRFASFGSSSNREQRSGPVESFAVPAVALAERYLLRDRLHEQPARQ